MFPPSKRSTPFFRQRYVNGPGSLDPTVNVVPAPAVTVRPNGCVVIVGPATTVNETGNSSCGRMGSFELTTSERL
jgi:hypothetical protein